MKSFLAVFLTVALLGAVKPVFFPDPRHTMIDISRPAGPVPYLDPLPSPQFHLTKEYARTTVDWVHPPRFEIVQVPWL